MESDRPSGGKKNRNNFFIFRLKIRSGHIYLAAANDCATICHEQRQHLKEFKVKFSVKISETVLQRLWHATISWKRKLLIYSTQTAARASVTKFDLLAVLLPVVTNGHSSRHKGTTQANWIRVSGVNRFDRATPRCEMLRCRSAVHSIDMHACSINLLLSTLMTRRPHQVCRRRPFDT